MKKLDQAQQLAKNPSLKYFLDDKGALPQDDDDNKPPVIFTGDLKQSKIIAQTNRNHGKGDFQYS